MNIDLFNMGKKIVLLFIASILLAAGTGEESLEIINVSIDSELQEMDPVFVTAAILSAWLSVLGIMCLYLEKIPGTALHSKRNRKVEE